MDNIYYFDMDGVLCNFHKEPYSYTKAINRNWIANLDPFPEAVHMVKTMIHEGKDIYINSLAASEEAKLGKIDWLHKYLPEINADHIIIIVGNGKKAEYMKTAEGILVDDKLSNCRQWTKISGQPAVWVEERGKVVL